MECACELGETLYVGTSDGFVLAFVPASHADAADDTETPKYMYSTSVRIGRSAVTMIRCFHSPSLLIALVDGYVSVLSTPSLRKVESIGRGRSVACIEVCCPDAERLFIGARRKLYVYAAVSTSLELLHDMTVPDTPRSICPSFDGSIALVAFRREYCIAQLSSSQCEQVGSLGRTGNHGACLLAEEMPVTFATLQDAKCIFLSASSTATCNSNAHGRDAEPREHATETPESEQVDSREMLQFNEPPTSISYSFPYVLAACSRGIECRCTLRGRAAAAVSQSLQTEHRVRNILPRRSMAHCSAKDQEASDGSLVVLESGVMSVWQPPLLQQVRNLAKQNFFESALVLSTALSDQLLRSQAQGGLYARYGYVMFAAGRYDDAMSLLQHSICTVEQALSLIPGLIPDCLRREHIPLAEIGKEALGEWHAPAFDDPEQDEAQIARAAAVPFLESLRQSESNFQRSHDSILIDTALVKALVANHASLKAFQELFWQSSFVADFGEVESTLSSAGREEEVIELLRSRSLHREALLRIQYLWNKERERFERIPKNERQERSQFGPDKMAEYIMNLDEEDSRGVALEFTPSILQQNPALGMQVIDSLKPGLSIDEVLEHLNQHCPGMRRAYLERLMHKDSSVLGQKHYDCLVDLYLDDTEELGEDADERQRLRTILSSTSIPYTPYRVLSRLQERTSRTWARERAVVYGRLGQHEEAVEAYAAELERPDLAEQHCDDVFASSSDHGAIAYLVLLRLLLEERGGASKEAATNMLARKGDRVDPMRALYELPEALPLGGLMPFFQSALRLRGDRRRHLSIMGSLYRAERDRLRTALVDARRAFIMMSAERACSVCKRRIDTSAFAATPQGELKHYRCYLATVSATASVSSSPALTSASARARSGLTSPAYNIVQAQ